MTYFHFKRLSVAAAILCCSFSQSFAQLSVSAATNNNGANLVFSVTSASPGNLTYEIRHAGPSNQLNNIATGTVTVQGNGQAAINFTPPAPGMYRCAVTQYYNTSFTVGDYKLKEIPTYGSVPDDFQSFWQSQKNVLSAIPPDVQLTWNSTNGYCTTYQISAAMYNNQRAYGYITIPNGNVPFPAVIQLPPFGNMANIVTPNAELATRCGVIVINLNIHPNQPYLTGPSDYAATGLSSASTVYYRHALMGVTRMIDYLATRSDYNNKVATLGDSQGGGLAMLAAGIDNRISLVMQCIAAMNAHNAALEDKPAGFPYYKKMATDYNLGVETVMSSVKYYDASYAMQFFNGTSFNIVGYRDEICPPASIFSGINASPGRHINLHLPFMGHNNPAEFSDYNNLKGIAAFLRRNWPETQTPPWPWPQTTLGYWINTGSDITLAQTGNTTLNAAVLNENGSLSTYPISWKQVKGPEGATIANPNAAYIDVNLTTSGEYEFECTATINDYGADRFFTLQDRVKVTVQNSTVVVIPNINISLTGPSSTIQGPFTITLLSSQVLNGLSASDFLVTNGLVTQLVQQGTNYLITITPTSSGIIHIQVPQNAATGLNNANTNASNTLAINYLPCTNTNVAPTGIDLDGPQVSCSNIVLVSPEGSCDGVVAPASSSYASASDACAISPSSMSTILAGQLLSPGEHNYTFTAWDMLNNASTCNGAITVLSTPQVNCPSNQISITPDADCNSFLPNLTESVVVNGVCNSNASLFKYQFPEEGEPLELGENDIQINVYLGETYISACFVSVLVQGTSAFFADVDGDGVGNANQIVWACQPGNGIATTCTDCDDSNPSISPLAFEISDNTDNDCNGIIDDVCANVNIQQVNAIMSRDSVWLVWPQINDASQYKIQWCLENETTFTEEPQTSNTFVLLRNVLPGLTYKFRISTLCNNEWQDYSATKVFKMNTYNAPCIAPRNAGSISVSPTSTRIFFNSASNAKNYRIRYRAVGSSTWLISNILGTSTVLSQPTTMLTSLQSATTYQYQVRALCLPYSSASWTAFGKLNTFTTAPPAMVCNYVADSLVANSGNGAALPNINLGETVIEQNSIENKGVLLLAPNPASNTTTIFATGPINQLLIFDLSGKVIRRSHNLENQDKINIEDLPIGLYFVKALMSDNTITVVRLLKQ